MSGRPVFKEQCLKKLDWHGIRLGRTRRYFQAEKMEIILMVEEVIAQTEYPVLYLVADRYSGSEQF